MYDLIFIHTHVSVVKKNENKLKRNICLNSAKTTWIYSLKIYFTSSPKNPMEITHKQSFDNGRLWNMHASYTIMSQHIFWCLSDLQLYCHSYQTSLGPSLSFVPSSPYSIPWVESFCSYLFRMIFLGKANCSLSISLSMLVAYFFLV